MIAAPIYCAIYYLYKELNFFISEQFFFWSMMTLLAATICIGTALTSFTHYAFQRKYNSSLGRTAFILSLILPWLLPIQNSFLLTGVTFPNFYFLGVTTRFALWFIGFLLLGIVLMFLIVGVVRLPDAWKIIYFQAGAFLLIPAAVLAMIVLLTNPRMTAR
jgi:hypothetical protein